MSIVPYETGSAAWHLLRSQHIGASEVAALFDVQPAYALSRWSLWQIKSGRAVPPPVDNPRVRWGNRLERVIAEAAAEEEGWTALRKGGYAMDDECQGLGASLDFEADCPGREGPGIVECKNADWMVHRRSWTDGEPPVHILLQLQAQLAASGYHWGCVVALVGGNDLHVYYYERHRKRIADIRRFVREFWQSIKDGIEPAVDGSDSASAVLRVIFPELIDEEIDLSRDNALPDICARMLHAAERRKEAEREEAEAKNQLFAKLGDARRALANGFRISVAVTPEKAPQPAPEGYVIPGRKEARRLNVKEMVAS